MENVFFVGNMHFIPKINEYSLPNLRKFVSETFCQDTDYMLDEAREAIRYPGELRSIARYYNNKQHEKLLYNLCIAYDSQKTMKEQNIPRLLPGFHLELIDENGDSLDFMFDVDITDEQVVKIRNIIKNTVV